MRATHRVGFATSIRTGNDDTDRWSLFSFEPSLERL
jgi:hypothetical protein